MLLAEFRGQVLNQIKSVPDPIAEKLKQDAGGRVQSIPLPVVVGD